MWPGFLRALSYCIESLTSTTARIRTNSEPLSDLVPVVLDAVIAETRVLRFTATGTVKVTTTGGDRVIVISETGILPLKVTKVWNTGTVTLVAGDITAGY